MVRTGGHLWWHSLSFKCSDNGSTEGASMPIREKQRHGPKDGRQCKWFILLCLDPFIAQYSGLLVHITLCRLSAKHKLLRTGFVGWREPGRAPEFDGKDSRQISGRCITTGNCKGSREYPSCSQDHVKRRNKTKFLTDFRCFCWHEATYIMYSLLQLYAILKN